MEVVGRAGDAAQLIAIVEAQSPDVVITDIRMPPTHTTEGLAAAVQIRESHPKVAVLLLSQYVETTHALRLLERGAGRVGYLLKDRVSDVREFLDTVRRVAGRWIGDRSRRGVGAAGQTPAPRRGRGADRTRARGAQPDGRGPFQHWHRHVTASEREDGRGPCPEHLLQARARARGRRSPARSGRTYVSESLTLRWRSTASWSSVARSKT